jgi:hypothetical protein
MKQLLTDIQNRLAAATRQDNVKLFAHVDLDWGQVDFYSDMPPVKFPCALIDVQSASYSNEGQRVQMGNVTVQIRVVDMVLSRTSAQAPAERREKAGQIFDLLRETSCLLHGWTETPGHYGRLVKKTFSRARRRDGLREYAMTFETILTDSSAKPRQQAANVVQMEIKTE